MAVNGVGRPSKGKRDNILAKPPIALGLVIRQNADASGLSYGEYMVALVADALGMPEYAPKPPRERAAELDIPKEGDSAAA